jgi:hypothetical protein
MHVLLCEGRDIAFTEVSLGRVRPNSQITIDEEEIRYAFPGTELEQFREHYVIQKQPMADIRQQLIKTGGSGEIDLTNITAVFYVIGVSPYDFIRLCEQIAPISRSLWRELIGRMLGEKFLLRRQVEGIRRVRPDCKLYFIGMPLRAIPYPLQLTEPERSALIENRNIIRSMVRDFLFDDVFMPGGELLDESLLSTNLIYTRSGREESEIYQKEPPTQSDLSHMNRAYGKQVFREFIEPLLQSLLLAAGELAQGPLPSGGWIEHHRSSPMV